MRGAWIGAIGLIGLVCAAFVPAFTSGFLWDDNLWLWDSPVTQAGDGILRAWVSADRWDFYPVTSSAFWIQWRLWERDPLGYHAVNVLLHGIGSVLVWLVLRRLGVSAAWLVAALFAVHPVSVSSVVWVTQLKNTLSLVFYAATLLAFFRFEGAAEDDRRSANETAGPEGKWMVAALVLYTAALATKSSTVVLPAVLLLAIRWRRGRIARSDLARTLPFAALALAVAVATLWFQGNRAIGEAIVRPEGFASRAAAAGWAVWFYAAKALAPFGLMMVYPRWDVSAVSPIAWIPAATLVIGAIGAFRARSRAGRAAAFGGGVFVITLVPVLGFVEMFYHRYSLVADHWQYLALPAILGLAVAAGALGLERIRVPRPARIALAALLVAGAGGLTLRHASTYRNELTLWTDNLAKNPSAWVAHNGIGSWLGRQGDHAAARERFLEAVRLNPENAIGYHNLGLSWEQAGDSERAISYYEQALETNPRYVNAHASLGRLLAVQGRLDEALPHLEEAIRINPRHGPAHYNLAVAFMTRGELDGAVEHFEAVLRTDPSSLDAHYLLAKVLVQRGDLEAAAEHIRAVLRLNPSHGEARAVLQALEQAMGPGGK